MPYGGSRSRSEWVTPKIFGVKTKVFLVESWYNSTLALPYRLSHATICGNRWHYIMRRGFGQGKFPRTASVVCRVAAGMGTAMVPAEEQ